MCVFQVVLFLISKQKNLFHHYEWASINFLLQVFQMLKFRLYPCLLSKTFFLLLLLICLVESFELRDFKSSEGKSYRNVKLNEPSVKEEEEEEESLGDDEQLNFHRRSFEADIDSLMDKGYFPEFDFSDFFVKLNSADDGLTVEKDENPKRAERTPKTKPKPNFKFQSK